MKTLLSILYPLAIILFFSCNSTKNENNNEEIDFDKEIEKIEKEEGIKVTDLEDLEEKMEEIMYESDDSNAEMVKDVVVIEPKGAESVEVDLKIGAGQLKLTGGASELLTGGFKYPKDKGKPEVSYNVENNKGFLKVAQKEKENLNIDKGEKYIWNLKFNNDIPLYFDVTLGAGVSDIFLSDLNIQHYNMVMGVGQTTIDLRGKWRNSTEIHLDGGIGLSKIYLPNDVGVKLKVTKGLGSIDIKNLSKQSKGEYINDKYGNSDISLKIYLKTGIGKIEVE